MDDSVFPVDSRASRAFVCEGCERSFWNSGGLTTHRKSCKSAKRKLSGSLDDIGSLMKKRRKNLALMRFDEHMSVARVAGQSGPPAAPLEAHTPPPTVQSCPDPLPPLPTSPPAVLEEDDRSLAQRRTRRVNVPLPKRYAENAATPPRPLRHLDVLPEAPAALPPPYTSPPSTSFPHPPLQDVSSGPVQEDIPPCPDTFARSPRNLFGLTRQYRSANLPDRDPDGHIDRQSLLIPADDVVAPASAPAPLPTSTSTGGERTPFHPYPNWSSFKLGSWYWTGSPIKSESSFRELLDLLLDTRFDLDDLLQVNWRAVNKMLAAGESPSTPLDDDTSIPDDWHETPVNISVPMHARTDNPGSHLYEAVTLCHRTIMSVIRTKVTDPASFPHLHFEPYELFWEPDASSLPVKVHGEAYTSSVFIEAHDKLQCSPREPGCTLQRVIFALIFASDATQLTDYGETKLWPLYMAVANESKWRRSKQSYRSFEHIAYFESLPSAFKDFVKNKLGKGKFTSALATHCHRELFHAQWEVLLDEEFKHAYAHGAVIKCYDGIIRRFYPRIFAYSADYPEKVILASIRNLGRCPCPRCLIPLARAHNLGRPLDRTQRLSLARVDDLSRRTRIDSARELIYKKGYTVNSKAVEELLSTDSLVPTLNAFSKHLGPLGFNLFDMLAVDLMHEYELGVWKSVLIHLLRLLDAVDEKLKDEFDRRCRLLPPFGRDIIRRIYTNRSELKRMTAHEYAELLKCAIPLFEGLLPAPHSDKLSKLLFTMAYWHGLAGLHLHTDDTVRLLDTNTTLLGQRLRDFKETTCAAYQTRELKREAEQRKRREVQAKSKASPTGPSEDIRRIKTLNLDTYKVHALGDYAKAIPSIGTTDSYSTRLSETEHRVSKSRYRRTSGKCVARSLSKIERRQRTIYAIRSALAPSLLTSTRRRARIRKGQHSDHITSNTRLQYNIGETENAPIDLHVFLDRNFGDPATRDFYTKLRLHLLPRIRGILKREEAADPDRVRLHPSSHEDTPARVEDMKDLQNCVFLKNDRIYHHKRVLFNYTTYDVLRAQGTINPATAQCHVMLLDSAEANSEPSTKGEFLYARVLGAYHANVIYTGPGMLDYNARRMDFLWVRWFKVERGDAAECWSKSELPQATFHPMHSELAFGFVDPADILRTCHVIPAFAHGLCDDDGAGMSRCAKDKDDYRLYYINCFSDHDMLLRYHWRMGIGHLHSHALRNQSSSQVLTIALDEAEGNEAHTIAQHSTDDGAMSTLEPEGHNEIDDDSLPSKDGSTSMMETTQDDIQDDAEDEGEEEEDKLSSDEEQDDYIDDDLDDAMYPGL